MTDWAAGDLDLAPPDVAAIEGPIRAGSEAHVRIAAVWVTRRFVRPAPVGTA